MTLKTTTSNNFLATKRTTGCSKKDCELGVLKLSLGSLALKLNVSRGGPTLSHVNTLGMFKSPAMGKLSHIEHCKTGRANISLDYYGPLKVGKRCLRGDGNPPARDNSSPYIQALIFTTFTITLMNTLLCCSRNVSVGCDGELVVMVS